MKSRIGFRPPRAGFRLSTVAVVTLVFAGLVMGTAGVHRVASAAELDGPAAADLSTDVTPDAAPMRFVPVHIFIDSGDAPLAAYQFELKVVTGDARIVGVEGGDHPAFAQPPYYDPAALSQSRIIIAALDTGADLPAGQTRVATLHMAVSGDTDPTYELHLTAAVTTDGRDIEAAGWVAEGE